MYVSKVRICKIFLPLVAAQELTLLYSRCLTGEFWLTSVQFVEGKNIVVGTGVHCGHKPTMR